MPSRHTKDSSKDDTTLYDVLGVSPASTQEDIKKAFHKASLRYHPDRNPEDPQAPQKYKEMSAAYEVLKDAEKRKMYDRYGNDFLKEGAGAGGGHGFPGGFADLFPHLFPGMRGSDGDHRTGANKGKPFGMALKVTLETLYTGETKHVPLTRKVLCKTCNGAGGKAGKKPVSCRSCNGQGARVVLRQMGPFVTQEQVICRDCDGEGETMAQKDKCSTCRGSKVVSETKQLEVNILQGYADGKQIKFRSEHDQVPGKEAGDVIIVLKQEPHPIFQRSDNDLVIKMKINLAESLCGFERIVKHLDKRSVLIKHPPAQPIAPGTTKKIHGQGMISMETHHTGDLIIIFDVEFPANFFADATAIKQLETLLPAKLKVDMPASGVEEAAPMTDCTHRASSSANRSRNGRSPTDEDDEDEDMDDEDGHSHAHAIPCPTQ